MPTEQHAADMAAIHQQTTEAALTRRWQYFTGAHPAIWATQKLQRSFASIVGSMTENYCGLAVQARVTRLAVTGWTGPDAAAAEGLWAVSRLPQRQDRLFRWAVAYGRAYLLLAETGDKQELYPAPPTRVGHLVDDADPNKLRVAGRVQQTQADRSSSSTRTTVTLYYADQTVTYEGDGTRWEQFTLTSEAAGLGSVPVQVVTPYGDGPVLLDQIIPSQDRINKLASNKLIAAEFGAFRQRVFFTRQQINDGDLRNLPDTAIVLDPDDGQAKVQEMSATDLSNYDSSKDSEINGLFTIASLPRHMRVNPGTPPSGEAIKADEAPLVEALLDHQREMGEGIVEALALAGVDAEPQWRNPAPRNELSEADTVSRYVMMGVPWQVAVQKFAGWSLAEVQEAEALQPNGSEPGANLFR